MSHLVQTIGTLFILSYGENVSAFWTLVNKYA